MTSNSIIVCDECKAEFEAKEVEFKKAQTAIEDKQFEVVYYKCPTCGKPYIVCMFDFYGKKLQEKYVKAVDSYRLAYQRCSNSAKLKQKLQKVEALKSDAIRYQQKVMCKYKNLLPEEIFV